MARRRSLGSSPMKHEQNALTHYRSAEEMGDRARKMANAGQCDRAFEYFRTANLQYGQALAHQQAGGGGHEVATFKQNASMAVGDAERAMQRFCLKR